MGLPVSHSRCETMIRSLRSVHCTVLMYAARWTMAWTFDKSVVKLHSHRWGIPKFETTRL